MALPASSALLFQYVLSPARIRRLIFLTFRWSPSRRAVILASIDAQVSSIYPSPHHPLAQGGLKDMGLEL